MRVFMEYGASINEIIKEAGHTPEIDECCGLIARKLQSVRYACYTVLWMRARQSRNILSHNAFVLMGKDMARLIAEEVWGTRRHPGWE